MIDDIITIIGIFCAAIFIHHTGQAKPRANIKKYRLESAHITIRRQYRPANGIGNTISLADRPIKKRDCIMPFKIGCVGKDQISIGNHFRLISIGIDDFWNLIFAGFVIFCG